MDTVLSINLIATNPAVRSGRPCVAGTGIGVTDIVAASVYLLQSPDEIAVGYGVTLAQVYTALAYYYEHQEQLDVDLRQQIELARTLKEQHLTNGGRALLA